MAENEFEEERLRRIAENNARMASLGVLTATKDVGKQSSVRGDEEPRSCARSRPRAKVSSSPHEMRRSSRQEGRERVVYTESLRISDGEEKSQRAVRKPREPKGDGSVPINAIYPPEETVEETFNNAEMAVQDISNPVFLKPMLPSHVSKGYWLQAPKPLVRHMPQGKVNFPLEHGNDTWDVVWLPRPGGGGGMSGGWRTFAIDMELKVGDVVAFEVVKHAHLRAHIFRADFTPSAAQVKAASGGGSAEEEENVAMGSGSLDKENKEAAPEEEGEEEGRGKGAAGNQKKRAAAAEGPKKKQPRRSKGGGRGVEDEEVKEEAVEDEEEEEEAVEEEQFVVEHIVWKEGTGKGAMYLIKWLGYGEEDNTWEPASNLGQAPHTYKWL